MVDLPKAIRAQVEQVEAMYAVPAPADPNGTPPTDPVATAPVETPAPTPVESTPPADIIPAEPAQVPAPVPAEPVAPAAQAPKAPGKKDDEATWEQRYRSLQGVHNHHMADLKRRLGERDADLEILRKQVQELREATSAKATQVDPKDAEAFGEDLVGAMHRIADAKFKHLADVEEGRIAKLEAQLKGAAETTTQTRNDVFLQQLGAVVPNFREVNSDPAFLDWLGQVDDVYGLPRQAALDNAAGALNAPQVAKVFQAFLTTQTGTPPKTIPAAPTRNAQLEKQVAPRTVAGPAPAPSQTPVQQYSARQVTEFYDDVARGRYRGREAEAQKLEASINEALAAGAIIP